MAKGQAGLVAANLQRLTGKKFELKIFKTQGDLQTDKPLWQMEGKDFFTKELDIALRQKEVDLVVHSYKDLSCERPSDFTLAAITERYHAQDILLINKNIVGTLPSMKEVIIGTSSPRRSVNLEDSLSSFLPGGPPVKTLPIRGNVPTRMEKMIKGDFHGIVLALAGLARLAQIEKSRPILQKLLASVDFMILPESVFPGAAAQGALALECLKDRDDLKQLLSVLNHSDTQQEVSREREAFTRYGGGCHLAVGITVKKIGNHFLHIHKGLWQERPIIKKWLESPGNPPNPSPPGFIGLPVEKMKDQRFLGDYLIKKIPLTNPSPLLKGNYLVASSYGIDAANKISPGGGLWASGVTTMKKLAGIGLWVHGSADSLGEKEIIRQKNGPLLDILLGKHPWRVLSHDKANSYLGEVIGTYRREIKKTDSSYTKKIKKIKSFYWTSFYQYERFTYVFPFIKKADHYCGLGKTRESFTKSNIQVTPLSGIEEFKRKIYE